MIRCPAYYWIACSLTLAITPGPSLGGEPSPLGSWIVNREDSARTSKAGTRINWEIDPSCEIDPRPLFPKEPPGLSEFLATKCEDVRLGLAKIQRDFVHQYTGKSLRCLGLTLAITAPLANSEADENFRHWYQRNVRSRQTNEWAKAGNRLGEHWLTVPVFVGAAAVGALFDDFGPTHCVGDWGKRSIRALIVGSPTVGVLQYGLGAGRPGEYENSSRWRPFHDNNAVAGHGFVGAVPFLTAASMTENRPLKWLFFAGSFWTCWARVNGESHFLSQSIIGWSVAYLAVSSVSETESEHRRWQLVPLEMPQGGTGVGVMLRF